MHIYPEKTMQMVYDEAAGVWNMVEIIPNGLTRSEIIVDTGDGRTQELDDLQGASATISIYSALADILTKNAPTTTTTTTTTTSTTTELPEIIKVSTTSSTADANLITTTVYTHLQTTNSNLNNSGLLAGNILQTTSVDPYPPTTTSNPFSEPTTTNTPDSTTILSSNDSNREFPYIPPTNIPPPILSDILTTPGSDLITQPQLIPALTYYLESNSNFTNNSDNDSSNFTNNNYYSVVTDEPVTISFVDLFNIKPKRVKIDVEDEVEIDAPESTTLPVNPVYKESEETVTNELESLDEESLLLTTTNNYPSVSTTQIHENIVQDPPANLPTTTYKSRFGNNRLSILPPTTTTQITSSSTEPITTTTTAKPRYKNQFDGSLEFAVYGILPNKTVVRKKPTPEGRSLGLVAYGILPNHTFVQKFSNGSMIAVDMSSEIEVLDIDPEMLLDPNSELYRTTSSSTTTTTTSNPIKSFSSTEFSDNSNQIEVTTIPDPIIDFPYISTTATFFEAYEDNLLKSSSSVGVLEKMVRFVNILYIFYFA